MIERGEKEVNKMGEMRIIGRKGDVKVEWHPDNPAEVEVAKTAFEENKQKGYKAFRMYPGERDGEEINRLDEYADLILFVPPMVGG